MTVKELRKALEGLPDQMQVLKTPTVYDTVQPVHTLIARVETVKEVYDELPFQYLVIS